MRSFGQNIALIFFLIIFLVPTQAQEIQVRDESDFSPISQVFIFGKNSKFNTSTNEEGVADLGDFGFSDTLIFQHPSYQLLITTKAAIIGRFRVVLLSKKIIPLNPYEVIAFKDKDDARELPFKINSIGTEEILKTNAPTTADLLGEQGEVLIQKSQAGGGSPIIRGFEANKVLLAIDGVRMNNAIYRSGHLQNSITIDPNILERAEVLFGPSSVIYGSDALGGVMSFYTRDPQFGNTDSNYYQVNTSARFASVNTSYITHVDATLGFDKWATLTSVTNSDFGDLRMGAFRDSNHPDFGKVEDIAVQINGADTQIVNPDQNLQVGTGYRQLDVLQKIMFKPSEKQDYTLNIQYSTSSKINRFDKLNDYRDSLLRFAEWHYGPQERLLASLRWNFVPDSVKLFDHLQVIGAFQSIEESRIERKLFDPARIHRTENVLIYSLNMDFIKALKAGQRFQYGVESYYNDVKSNSFSQDINSGEKLPAATRYPDGGSFMLSVAGYMNYKRKIGKMINLNTGARFNYVGLHSDFNDTSYYPLPFDQVTINTNALTWAFGLVFRPSDMWKLNVAVSSGFRAPNVDDYGKVFAKNNDVVVPNNRLDPEFAYNGEVGISRSFGEESEVFKIQGIGFYTLLQDAIVRKDFLLNNSDTMLYDGEYLNIQTNVNSNQAYIYGGSLVLSAQLGKRIKVRNSNTYTYGWDITDNAPLGHIPPFYGKAGITYSHKKMDVDIYSLYNGRKPLLLYSPSGVDNEDETLPGGAPAWYTLNGSFHYMLTKGVTLRLGVANILDLHYKPFASGISAPGRNFIASLRATI